MYAAKSQVLRHSTPQIPPNSGGNACRVAEFKAAFIPRRRNENIQMGFEPTTFRVDILAISENTCLVE